MVHTRAIPEKGWPFFHPAQKSLSRNYDGKTNVGVIGLGLTIQRSWPLHSCASLRLIAFFYLNRLYLTIVKNALMPSRQVIFLPSS